MENFLEAVKDIASIIGCILSISALISLCVKPIRNKILKITHTEKIKKQDERITVVEKELGSVGDKLDEIKLLIFTNEKDRLRGELFNCGNRCRRGIPLTLEEFRYIQTVGDKYINTLHCNSIGEEEYKFICDYYNSPSNQETLKRR